MSAPQTISPEALLAHWQGHRRLTRRVIEAFPDEQLYGYSIGGMRPFGVMALELLTMDAPMVRGVVTGEWITSWDREKIPKADLLKAWDAATAEMEELWPKIGAERFQERVVAFGQYESKVIEGFFYVIDNQIHHRAQGYVYLRALGIEPPPFFVRD